MPDSRMLAVALGARTMRQALDLLPRIASEADLVELRLDLFEEPFDIAALLEARGSLPVVATLRSADEGGRCALPAADRVEPLVQAAAAGAEYVDLEWNAARPEHVAALKAAGARLIISRHDFRRMPPELAKQWGVAMAALGADVVKVVGTAVSPRDCLLPLWALGCADRPTIALAMGDAGLATRILCLRDPHCLLTYAALDADTATAPGQITLSAMRDVYRVRRLGPGSAVYGLLGPHVEENRLAAYNHWFEACAIDAVAVPFSFAAAADTVRALRELPVSGWHIHGEPRQRDVLQALDRLRPAAQRQGKANAIVAGADGSLEGDWVESPAQQFEVWTGQAPVTG